MYLSVHPSISLTNATDTERDLHIGYTLHKLFKMLLLVNEVHMGCGKIVDALVMTTSIVMKQVTVNVFCTWAEVSLKIYKIFKVLTIYFKMILGHNF